MSEDEGVGGEGEEGVGGEGEEGFGGEISKTPLNLTVGEKPTLILLWCFHKLVKSLFEVWFGEVE